LFPFYVANGSAVQHGHFQIDADRAKTRRARQVRVRSAPNQLIKDKSMGNANVGATQRWIGRNTVG
jgi:hypothetical protein